MRFLVPVVGMRFRERYENHINLLREDLKHALGFKFEFDSSNTFDSFAIKALMNLEGEWYHFGFISRDYNGNSDLRNLIESGRYSVELSKTTSFTNVVKLRVFSEQ